MMSSRTYVLIGGKGGVGATTLACELAANLQRREGEHVALVDGDLNGRRSVGILIDGLDALDAALYEDRKASFAMTTVREMTAIELAANLDQGFTVRPEAIEELANALYGHTAVVVDAPQPFAAAVRPFIVRALRFLVVAEPSLLGIANARDTIGNLHKFGAPMDRIAAVLSIRGESDVSGREVAGHLGVPVIAEIPARSDRRFERAIEALATALTKLKAEPALFSLQPSIKLAVGDRRAAARPAGHNGHNGSSVPHYGNGGASLTDNGEAVSVPTLRGLDEHEAVKSEVFDALSKRIDLVAASRVHTDSQKLAQLRADIERIATEVISQRGNTGSAEDAARLREEVIDETLGLGPVESLLRDSSITEVMVNGLAPIYIERAGKIEQTTRRFIDEQQLMLVIERIIAPLGRRVDESSPMVDARLPDGSRVNAIIRPLALDGPALTIRRFGSRRLDKDDLARIGTANYAMIDFLRAGVEARLNVLISGGSGAGKTTLLNVVSAFIPSSERIVTIEDAAELLLSQTHVVRLESRPPNVEGQGEIRIRELVRNALRMRPDRIVVGECRGGEALDMLQAMNTGHEGSLTTVHANSARDALSRVETMVLMAGFDIPVRAVREQIASALDLIVHVSRFRDGKRRVVGISEIVGMEGDVVTMQDIMHYHQKGVDDDNQIVGDFEYTGVQPQCLSRFEEMGIEYDVRDLSELMPAGLSW